MLRLKKIINALNSVDIKPTAKKILQQIDPSFLPLQKGLSYSSSVSSKPFSIIILSIKEQNDIIGIKSGVFYTGIIAGCSCSDDPSPIDEQNEYCEILFNINKFTAETDVILLT